MSTISRDEGAVRADLDTASPPLTTVHKVAVGLAVVTGLIHLYIGLVSDLPIFILAAAGFFFGIGALVMFGQRGRVVLYVLGLLYTGGQVTIWLLLGMPSPELGIPDKLVQVGLLALLTILLSREAQALTRPR